MNKIAIIDTDVNPAGLHCQSFEPYSIYYKKYQPSKFPSHGTRCAKILDYCTSEYALISIQIFPTCAEPGEKPFGSIWHLRKALALCQELEPDIICLSSVSSLLSDSKHLYGVSKELSKRSIIISALDNKRYITVPSCYPFVVGVQSDRANSLRPGSVAYCEGDPYFAPCYANCNFPFLMDGQCTPSNSLAVPVAAAHYNNSLNRGIAPRRVISLMKPYARPMSKEGVRHNPSPPHAKYDPPIVSIHSAQTSDSFHACQKAMDELYSRYNVQASGLCEAMPEYDIRFRKLESWDGVQSSVEFMGSHYKTDLIFLAVGANRRLQLDCDMRIVIEGCRIKVHYNKICSTSCIKDIAFTIYHVLQ